jgi:Asp-tRNA(Asn)/Glu-tRNA(Gln) amidotransferase C subunit
LPSGEEDVVAERMAEVVEFAGRMSSLAGEEALVEGRSSEAVVREAEDVPGECLERDLVLANAPESRDGFVRLPPIRRTGREDVATGEEIE